MATNPSDSILYAVLKLQTTISYTNPVTGEDVVIALHGCAGYIPVFRTVQEASEYSCDGKFQIAAIKC